MSFVELNEAAVFAALSDWVEVSKPVELSGHEFLASCKQTDSYLSRPRFDDRTETWIKLSRSSLPTDVITPLIKRWNTEYVLDRTYFHTAFRKLDRTDDRITKCLGRLSALLNDFQVHPTTSASWRSFDELSYLIENNSEVCLIASGWTNLVHDIDLFCARISTPDTLFGRPCNTLRWQRQSTELRSSNHDVWIMEGEHLDVSRCTFRESEKSIMLCDDEEREFHCLNCGRVARVVHFWNRGPGLLSLCSHDYHGANELEDFVIAKDPWCDWCAGVVALVPSIVEYLGLYANVERFSEPGPEFWRFAWQHSQLKEATRRFRSYLPEYWDVPTFRDGYKLLRTVERLITLVLEGRIQLPDGYVLPCTDERETHHSQCNAELLNVLERRQIRFRDHYHDLIATMALLKPWQSEDAQSVDATHLVPRTRLGDVFRTKHGNSVSHQTILRALKKRVGASEVESLKIDGKYPVAQVAELLGEEFIYEPKEFREFCDFFLEHDNPGNEHDKRPPRDAKVS